LAGAPERVLERCKSVRLADGSTAALKPADRAALLKKVSEMAARPLRCLAMAVREDVGALGDYDGPTHKAHSSLTDPSKFVDLEKDLVFVGVCGIKDPARPEVAQACVCAQQQCLALCLAFTATECLRLVSGPSVASAASPDFEGPAGTPIAGSGAPGCQPPWGPSRTGCCGNTCGSGGRYDADACRNGGSWPTCGGTAYCTAMVV